LNEGIVCIIISAIKKVVPHEGDFLEVFYYHSAFEIWPEKRSGLWWEWPNNRSGLPKTIPVIRPLPPKTIPVIRPLPPKTIPIIRPLPPKTIGLWWE
jgi:hypothetical protein